MAVKQKYKTMDIQSRKIAFVQDFLSIYNEDTIVQFEELLKQEKKRQGKEIPSSMSVSELNKRIDRSEDDFKNGRYNTSSELIAKYRQ